MPKFPKAPSKMRQRKLQSGAHGVKARGKGYDKRMELEEEDEMMDPEVNIFDYDLDQADAPSRPAAGGRSPADSDDDDDEELDSDAELQEALLSGRMQPGLHAQVAVRQKVSINNETALLAKLNEIRLSLDWVERLDVTSSADDLPPHVLNPLKDPETAEAAGNELDLIRNDIRRELLFTQQARASVFKALQKLHRAKIATSRPADYFAQMLKSEKHMTHVQKRKDQKVELAEKKEKAKQLREQKKMSKKIQVEVLQQRQREKREFNEKVKKVRQGKLQSTDFLDEKPKKAPKRRFGSAAEEGDKPKHMTKRDYKQSKYGNGGIKRDAKKNTAESASSFSDFRAAKHSVGGKKGKRGPGSRAKKQSSRARKGN